MSLVAQPGGMRLLRLFCRIINARTRGAQSPGVTPNSQSAGASLYIDTENLQSSAQGLVGTIIEQWPEGTPTLSRLYLYVQADRVSLWDAWASSRFPLLTVTVRGIQHFTSLHSKNSADIAIAIDAVADLVIGTTQFVAVMSDDSDFMPLYTKLKELGGTAVPFLWVMTDRTKTKASTIQDFFPNDQTHILHVPARSTRALVAGDDDEGDSKLLPEMAETIIREIPVGSFKSVECQPIIESGWPTHPLVSMPGQQFGIEFVNKLWPILEGRGVKLLRTKPRKYEMTSEAKDYSQARNGDSQLGVVLPSDTGDGQG